MKTKLKKTLEKTNHVRTPTVLENSSTALDKNTYWKKTWKPELENMYSWILQKGAQRSCLIK